MFVAGRVIIQFLCILPGPCRMSFGPGLDSDGGKPCVRCGEPMLLGTETDKTQKQTIIKGMQYETFGSAFLFQFFIVGLLQKGGVRMGLGTHE